MSPGAPEYPVGSVVRLEPGEQVIGLRSPSLCAEMTQQLLAIRSLLEIELSHETRSKLERAAGSLADAVAFHAHATTKPYPSGWAIAR